MGKINFKQIGTFEEFCKAKQKQLIKESNEVAIDVPFYNEAVDQKQHMIPYVIENNLLKKCNLKPILSF